MRLRGEKLKRVALERGLTPEQLGPAIERTGLTGDSAVRAIRNWMANRASPAPKATDIRKLAEAMGCGPKDIARFTSMVRQHRGSPRKAKLLVDLIRGRGILEAQNLLRFTPKRAALNVMKCLAAAIEDAKQMDADEALLFVSHSTCDEGSVMKRFQPKDRGRAHQILKRFSHITVGVEEREPKSRKSPAKAAAKAAPVDDAEKKPAKKSAPKAEKPVGEKSAKTTKESR